MIKEKIVKNGKRWQKAGMDRIYLNYSQIENIEVDGFTAYNWLNRFQRQNIKIYWDNKKDELVITQGSDEAKEHIKRAIEAM